MGPGKTLCINAVSSARDIGDMVAQQEGLFDDQSILWNKRTDRPLTFICMKYM